MIGQGDRTRRRSIRSNVYGYHGARPHSLDLPQPARSFASSFPTRCSINRARCRCSRHPVRATSVRVFNDRGSLVELVAKVTAAHDPGRRRDSAGRVVQARDERRRRSGSTLAATSIRSRRFAADARSPRAIRQHTNLVAGRQGLMQKEIEHDKAIRISSSTSSRCMGCRTCAVACKRRAQSCPSACNLRRVLAYEASGSWRQDRMTGAWHQDVRRHGTSRSPATTATNPACVKVCPTKAHCEARRRGRPRRSSILRQVHRLRHVRAGLPLRCASCSTRRPAR